MTTTYAPQPPAAPARRHRDDAAAHHSRLERPVMLVVLAILAYADAYQFWITLARIIQRAPYLTMIFVGALALAAVTAAHIAGQLVRSRREGYGGSLGWIMVIAVLWLSLGTTLAWIRMHHENFEGEQRVSGDLVETGGAAAGVDATAVQMAGLLLLLYLLTGAVAMTHAYRFGDPRSAAVRQALRERRQLSNEIARISHLQHLADAEHRLRTADRKRDQEQSERELDMAQPRATELRAGAHQRTAGHLGDPAATDGLTLDGHHHAHPNGDPQ